MIFWTQVLNELQFLAEGSVSLREVDDLTVDTLYGSMYGLNHRYMTLEDCLAQDSYNVLSYAMKRISKLVRTLPVTFRERSIPPVHQIGFGTYKWNYDTKLVRIAVKHGLLIDTAEGYGYGRVEEALGEALSSIDTPATVTTKVSRSHMSPRALHAAAVRSLKKLGVVPHYQLHFPHAQYSDEDIGRVLVSLRRAGIILSIGLGNCSIDMIESMQSFLSDHSGDVIRSVQVRYNLMDRRVERTLIPYCQERGITIIAYSPLGQRFYQMWKPVLDKVGKQQGCTAAQVALAWVMRLRGIVPIPQTNDPKHLEANIDAANVKLDRKAIEELEQEYPIQAR